MKININSRGNGACPLCKHSDRCRLKKAISQSVEGMGDDESDMELVVYACPRFAEKE